MSLAQNPIPKPSQPGMPSNQPPPHDDRLTSFLSNKSITDRHSQLHDEDLNLWADLEYRRFEVIRGVVTPVRL